MSIFKNIHIIRTKRNTVATSTPVKAMNPVDQSPFFEWPSPLGQRSNESHSPDLPVKKQHEAVKPLGRKKSSEKSDYMDKICLVNRTPVPYDEPDDFVANTADVGLKSNRFKQWIIMDSDVEDEFQKNRNSDTQKRKKNGTRKTNKTATQPDVGVKKDKRIDPVRSASNSEETDSESIRNGFILPKIANNNNSKESAEEKRLRVPTTLEWSNEIGPSKNSMKKSKESETTKHPPVVPWLESLNKDDKATELKSTTKKSKELEEDAPPEDSDAPKDVVTQKNQKKIVHGEEENVVRRSNRKRCKPLEFWNGERQEIDIDFALSLEKLKKPRRNVSKIKAKDAEKVDGIEQSEATDIHNSNNKDVGRRKSILKSKTKSGTKASVKFSPTIETDTPAAEKSEKIDWVKNFDQLTLMQKIKSDCVTLSGLSTAGGKMSSSVIQIRPESMKQGHTLHSHDLIFCLMIGAVTVTVRKTSAQIERYGHFAVPGGVSYCIKNTGSKSAVLSCFEVSCESK